MSGDTWKVNTDSVGRASRAISMQAKSTEVLVEELKVLVEELIPALWRGEGAGAFSAKIASWQITGQQLIDRLHDLSDTLSRIQSVYVTAHNGVQEIWR